MENTEEKLDPQYLKGFNQGYLIAKYKPELMKHLENAIKDITPFGKGFLHGRAEHRMEKMKSKLRISSKENPSRSKQPTTQKGKSK